MKGIGTRWGLRLMNQPILLAVHIESNVKVWIPFKGVLRRRSIWKNHQLSYLVWSNSCWNYKVLKKLWTKNISSIQTLVHISYIPIKISLFDQYETIEKRCQRYSEWAFCFEQRHLKTLLPTFCQFCSIIPTLKRSESMLWTVSRHAQNPLRRRKCLLLSFMDSHHDMQLHGNELCYPVYLVLSSLNSSSSIPFTAEIKCHCWLGIVGERSRDRKQSSLSLHWNWCEHGWTIQWFFKHN